MNEDTENQSVDQPQPQDPPVQYVGQLELSKRQQVEDRLRFWASERDRMKAAGRSKRALYYHGKVMGCLEAVDIVTYNPEYVGWLRRRYGVQK